MKNDILDLGCGKNKVKNSIGMDKIELEGVDVIHNLLSIPYPFKEKSFKVIYLRHVIEHFKIEDINTILLECYRILSTNGKLIITVPHVFSVAAYTDITHKIFFTFNSGKFFDYEHPMSYYYKKYNINYKLIEVDCKVCWFDWKSRFLQKLDVFLSRIARYILLNAIKNTKKPSLADRIVKKRSYQFVEIKWVFKKNN